MSLFEAFLDQSTSNFHPDCREGLNDKVSAANQNYLMYKFESSLYCTLSLFVVVGVWLKITELLVKLNICSSSTGRKWVHIVTGPLFVALWPLYPSNDPSAKYYAASIPALIVARFALIGLQIIKDEETVKSMSRSGNPRELLYGPLFYGIVVTSCTIFYWCSTIGIASYMLLCVGDGFAGLFGQMYGRKRLPWNRSKSWVGTVSFFIGSVISMMIYFDYFHSLGYISYSSSRLFPATLIVSFLAMIVESLPYQNDWDNLTVFFTAIATMNFLGVN